MSQADRAVKTNKASENHQKITASKEQIRDLKTTQDKWKREQDQHPGASSKKSKYTSNKTHYSPTDPDARVSVKPGKARKLNFFSQMAVDTAHHVISHIHADYAYKADNQCLESIFYPLRNRLQQWGESCIFRTKGYRFIYTTPWHLQRRSRRIYLSQRRGLLGMSTRQICSLQENRIQQREQAKALLYSKK